MNRSSATIGFIVTLATGFVVAVSAGAQPVQASAAAPASIAIGPAEASLQGERALRSNDYAGAMRWYRFAADQGDPLAQAEVGYFYHHGLGVAQDYAEAMRWYRRAADQGNALAQHQIGYLYEHGLGVGQDYDQAIHCFGLAADQGWPMARYNIAYLGVHGHCADKTLAEAWSWQTQAQARNVTPPYIWPGRDPALRGLIRH
jgi:TPR repeat protein